MKIIDEIKTLKNDQNNKKTNKVGKEQEGGKGERGTETVVKRRELNDFVVLNAQLAFLQLICKAS